MDIQRKLASIRTVNELVPIEGADFIELAKIDGWQCVVKKGVFTVGGKGVYMEIDSFLPVQERYEFLRKNYYRKMADDSEGFRIKTIKLKKYLSQGLLLHISDFPEIPCNDVGTDVTEILGIKKWEPALPVALRGFAKGNFPSYLRKTDQERIQNLKNYFTEHKDTEFEISIKLDGSSMTAYIKDGEFGVCSRNIDLKETEDNTFWKVANRYKLRDVLSQYQKETGRSIAIQGELIGEGVQGNPEKIKGHELYLFDVFLIDEQRYAGAAERFHIWKHLQQLAFSFDTPEIKHVPVLGIQYVFRIYDTMELLLAYADGKSLNASIREGLVFKSLDGTVSFKAISNEFLLKEKD